MGEISTFYIKNSQIIGEEINLIGLDVNHIKNVLRYKAGDELTVCDEAEQRYLTKIKELSNECITLHIEKKMNFSTEPSIKITLIQGLPKFDKMDLIVQKCTELGVEKIIPVIMERTVVKIDGSNGAKKVERWNKIALEASKQCGRTKIPTVEKIVNLENIVENLSKYDIVIVPYECEKENMIKAVLRNTDTNIGNVAVVIGPEGGFSEKDISVLEKLPNVKKVSLGERILRTETAGIVTVAMLLYEYDM